MNPGLSWPDLHYLEAEQVQLDVTAIIARGTRLRRKRLLVRGIAIALVCAAVPGILIIVKADPPATRPVIAGPRVQGFAGLRQYTSENGPARGEPANGTSADNDVHVPTAGHIKVPATMYGGIAAPVRTPRKAAEVPPSSTPSPSLAQVVVRQTTTLPGQYGPLLAITGASGGSGVWFTAIAAQLTLFRLSVTGALSSWLVPAPPSSTGATTAVGLAVTPAGVAWVGVGSTLIRLDTKTTQVSSWHIPVPQPNSLASQRSRSAPERTTATISLAVSPDGQVALAMPMSSSVQVLDPRSGTFQQIRLPNAADQPLAVGYARNGVLGIGYRYAAGTHPAGVLLVSRTGGEKSVGVAQPSAVAPYGASELLVGVTELSVISSSGGVRPLVLPSGAPDFANVMTPPASLPGDRLGIVMDTAVLTFPAAAASSAIATGQSELWVTPPWNCSPHRACPAGYRLLATDLTGDIWVVPAAEQRTIELVSLR